MIKRSIALVCAAALLALAQTPAAAAGRGRTREETPPGPTAREALDDITKLIRDWRFPDAFALTTAMLNSDRKLDREERLGLYIKLGVILKMLGRKHDATGAFNEALKLDARSADALYYLSMLNLATGNIHAARAYSEKLAAAAKNDPWSHIAAASVRSFEGAPELAFESAGRARRIDPDIFEARIFEYNRHRKKGDHEKARTSLKEMLSLAPNFERAMFFSAGSYASRREARNAVKAETLCEYGLVTYTHFASPATALKYYDEAIGLAPSMAKPKLAKAQCMVLAGSLKKAAKLVDEALAADPGYRLAQDFRNALQSGAPPETITAIDISTGMPARSIGDRKTCPRCGHKSRSATRRCRRCGAALEKKPAGDAAPSQRTAETELLSENAFAADDSAFDEEFERGVAALESGDHQGAAKSLEALVAKYPSSSEAHNMLGVTYLAAGRNEDAVKCFNRSVALNPYFMEGYYSLGKTYEMMGKPRSAAAMYRKALSIDPQYEEARTALDKLDNAGAQKGESPEGSK